MKLNPSSYFFYTGSPVSKFKSASFVCLAMALFIMSFIAPSMALSNDNDTLSADPILAGQGNVSEYNHLIEVSLLNEGYVVVSESMVYLIESAEDQYTNQTEISLWIPENAEIMQFQATDMVDANSAMPVNFTRDENYLYFYSEDNEVSTNMPLLYGIRYVVPDTGNEVFRKVIQEDGKLEQPISRLITVVHHNEYTIPRIISADGNTIMADETMTGDNYTSFSWSSPQFKEFSIIQENKETPTLKETGYNYSMIIGILLFIIIVGVVFYYKKKDSTGYSKDISELEDLYDAEMAVITRIKQDRKNNKLSQAEFEKLKKKHSENASKIKSEMEKLKKS